MGAETTKAEMTPRLSFQIDCLRAAKYHEDREWFFAAVHRIAMFVVVASGTAIFVDLKKAPIFAGISTLAGLIDLVFDVSGKARKHADQRRRIFDILAQAEDETKSITGLREQLVKTYADDLPTMHAVNALAYNSAMEAFGRDGRDFITVTRGQRFWRHIFPFSSLSSFQNQ